MIFHHLVVVARPGQSVGSGADSGKGGEGGIIVSSIIVRKIQFKSRLPVPKLGPPLKARCDISCPCITPALTSSKNRYKGSWNLSFTRALVSAACMAFASGEWVCWCMRNLRSDV